MAEDRIDQTNRSAPSTHGLHAPAQREKPWASTAEASMERKQGALFSISTADMKMVAEASMEKGPLFGSPSTADMKMAGEKLKIYQTTQGLPAPTFLFVDTTKPGCEKLGFPDQLNVAEDRDPVELGMALGADSNMKEDSVTAKKKVKQRLYMAREKRRIYQTNRSAPSTHGLHAPAQREKPWASTAEVSRKRMKEALVGMPMDADMEIDGEKLKIDQTNRSAPPTQGPTDEYEHVELARLMDSRMYMQATQGHVGDFIRILRSISIEKKLQQSIILCQVSHRNNTCLHIAVSFGHHELAKYIVGLCPDLIDKTNSKDDTALHIAARKKDLSFVKFAMDSCPSGSGASRDVEQAEQSLLGIVNKEGNTVLHEALINRCKQEEVVEILIKAYPQVAYDQNKEGKSLLYLAAEARYFHVVEAIGKPKVEKQMNINRGREAKPAVHGAILGKNKEMLEKILAMELVDQKDKHGKTPLYYAASIGYLKGVQTLLGQSKFGLYQRDEEGFLPIHVASIRGYVDIVKELLQVSFDSIELLSKQGENILHMAAKYGKDNVVNFVLKKKGLENLINEKDESGNTPLHLATMHAHPKVVNYLTWDKRVDVNLVNNEGQTAFDIAVSVEHPTSFYQRLIWTALKATGARPAGNSKVPPKLSKSPNTDDYKDRVNTLLLVSTLVATVTFAAGFTMPGGYKSSDPNAGMAIFLMRNMFQMFVICNTIAMYTSILAAIILIWAQLGDLNLVDTAFRWALPFLGLALYAMSLGFMAGVSLVISNLHWLAIVVFIIGIICLVSLSVPFLLLFIPSKSTYCILRHISYYPFLLLVWASEGPKIKQED